MLETPFTFQSKIRVDISFHDSLTALKTFLTVFGFSPLPQRKKRKGKIVILKSESNKSPAAHSRLNFSFVGYTPVNARTNTASYNLIDPPRSPSKVCPPSTFHTAQRFSDPSLSRSTFVRQFLRHNFSPTSFTRNRQ